jgi:hypothetical protein
LAVPIAIGKTAAGVKTNSILFENLK